MLVDAAHPTETEEIVKKRASEKTSHCIVPIVVLFVFCETVNSSN